MRPDGRGEWMAMGRRADPRTDDGGNAPQRPVPRPSDSRSLLPPVNSAISVPPGLPSADGGDPARPDLPSVNSAIPDRPDPLAGRTFGASPAGSGPGSTAMRPLQPRSYH